MWSEVCPVCPVHSESINHHHHRTANNVGWRNSIIVGHNTEPLFGRSGRHRYYNIIIPVWYLDSASRCCCVVLLLLSSCFWLSNCGSPLLVRNVYLCGSREPTVNNSRRINPHLSFAKTIVEFEVKWRSLYLVNTTTEKAQLCSLPTDAVSCERRSLRWATRKAALLSLLIERRCPHFQSNWKSE